MLVSAEHARRVLEDYGDGGVPGFEKLEYRLEPVKDRPDTVELVVGGHASAAAFAKAAGLVEASPPPLELKCVSAPQIIGLPNVGQYVTADLGIWEEPDPNQLPDPGLISRPSTNFRWLYDGNEQDPVVIPEGDPHDVRDLLVPALAIGRTIVLRVTRGATTVYSEDFGPIEGGLTEHTSQPTPVPDTDTVSADPGARRRSGASQSPDKPKRDTQTPSTGSGKTPETGLRKSGPPGRPVSPEKARKLAEQAAGEKTPLPAAQRASL